MAVVSGGALDSNCSLDFPLSCEEVGEVECPSPTTVAMEMATDGVDISRRGSGGKSQGTLTVARSFGWQGSGQRT